MAKKQVRPLRPYAAEADAGSAEQVPAEETVSVVQSIIPIPTAWETMLSVRFELPLPVLIALIEPLHPKADLAAAVWYGLIDIVAMLPTPIGNAVLSGVDQTAIRHKMR